jgi:site-specific DNA-methyltransferase (adenine-specific)
MEQMTLWKAECSDSFPQDKRYQIIYADPPWQYQHNSAKLANQCEAHYPVMSFEDLQMLNVASIADKDCSLFLWTSNPMLPKAIALIEHWGFVYKTVFKVWRKVNKDGSNVMVPGWWSRSSTELLIVATKGSPLKKYKCANHTEPQEYTSTRSAHSEKPDEIRECIENFMNVENKIELFARKVVSGWDAWGLEVPGFYYTCKDPIIYENGKRSLGIQVDLLKEKPYKKTGNKNLSKKIKDNGSVPIGHKAGCGCFVCKRLRISNG